MSTESSKSLMHFSSTVT